MSIDKDIIHKEAAIIGDCIDNINEIKGRIKPVLVLMCLTVELNPNTGEVLTREDISNLGLLLRDLLDEIFCNIDNIENVYRRMSSY